MRLAVAQVFETLKHKHVMPLHWRPRVSVSSCLSRSEPTACEALRAMTQRLSVVSPESQILRGEGSFETAIFACGLRRRRFSARRPAQPPNGSQQI